MQGFPTPAGIATAIAGQTLNTTSPSVAVADAIYSHLTLDGDGSTVNWAVDGTTPAKFYYQAPAGGASLVRVFWVVRDNANFSADNFGGLGAALTNGMLFQVLDTDGTTVLLDLLDGVPIKSNLAMNGLFYDASYVDYGSGDNAVVGRWTFSKDLGGSPLVLAAGQRLQITVQDNLSTLVNCEARVRGYVPA